MYLHNRVRYYVFLNQDEYTTMTVYAHDYPSQFELDKFYATAEKLTKLYPFKSPFKGVKVKHSAKGVSYVVEQGHLYVGTYTKLQDAVTAYGAPHTKFRGPLCRLSEFLSADQCFDPSADYTTALQAAMGYAKTQADELELGWELFASLDRDDSCMSDVVFTAVSKDASPAALIERVATSLVSAQLTYDISVHVALSSIALRAKETSNV